MTPEAVGLASAPQDAVAAGTPEKNAGIARQVLGGEKRRRARPHRAERGRRDLRGRRGRVDRGGSAQRPRRRSTRAPRPTCSSAGPPGPWSWRRERAARGAGRGDAGGARAPQARRAARRAGARRRPARRPPVRRGAGRAGHVADRRAQAPLTLGGRDPGGVDLRGDRPGLRARWAPPPCRSSPRRPTSAARSTICARRGRPPTCRSCARTSPSTPTCSTRPTPRARTPCCWWSARCARASWPSCTRPPASSTWTRSSRSPAPTSWRRRSRSTPT